MPGDDDTLLDVLKSMLTTAARAADELLADPLLARLLDVSVEVLRPADVIQRGVDISDPQWRDLVTHSFRQMDRAWIEKLARFNRAIQEILDVVSSEEPRANADAGAPVSGPPGGQVRTRSR